ncbi:MAG TPA: DUF4388 domain-containing protein [Anaerolineaceae bacterium]|nr:DUF4388 domain-containing protein [Anaerolineaceae bacterium]HPN52152.1 DUF4388 domain-containing protein [Anaerolineaceae bacterium]
MGTQGSLHDMTVADLIQVNCQDHKTGKLSLNNGAMQGNLYFKNGNVIHAEMGQLQGEAAVYELLSWEEGLFKLDVGHEAPQSTITRSWAGLIMEGARLLDEKLANNDSDESVTNDLKETIVVAPKIEDILKEMGGEMQGYIASAVTGMDGLNIAQHSKTNIDPEAISAQMTMLLKLVDSTVGKLDAGTVQDNLVTTANAYVLMRFLPGRQHFLGVAVDRKAANLGNMRLIANIYSERIYKAIPR